MRSIYGIILDMSVISKRKFICDQCNKQFIGRDILITSLSQEQTKKLMSSLCTILLVKNDTIFSANKIPDGESANVLACPYCKTLHPYGFKVSRCYE